jgi:N6-adenosine-specific RNA methylase IME4
MTYSEIIEMLPDAPTRPAPQSAEFWERFRCECRAIARLSSKHKALKALDAMERELDSPRTYEQIHKTIKAAEAFKLPGRDMAEVKQKAEWVILIGNQRIGEEIKKVPKATHKGGPKKQITPQGKSVAGRAATGIPGTSRSRLQKLANIERDKLKAMAEEMWESGRDATIKGILGEVKEDEIEKERAEFEKRRDKGATVDDLHALAASGYRAGVIYVDAPWEFRTYSGKGKQRSAERHYDVMTLDQIKALPVAQLAAKDCALFLWGVCPELPGALEVMKAWGFEYKTVAFAWIKATKNAEGVTLDGKGLHWGMGYHTRSNIEFCLLGLRGTPTRLTKDVHQVILSPVGEHSVKPEEVRERIERLYPGPNLELFARRPVEGWRTWGNELEKST